MTDLNILAPNYCRARELWPNAPTLSRCHDALQVCVSGNTHGLVEQVKSFIESVCLTILTEYGVPLPSTNPSTTELLVAALRPLGLQNTRGASKLDKVLSGFNRLADALNEIRNEEGALAHGKDAFLDAITNDHARAFLHAGDAILGVLLNALEGKEPDLNFTREPYERFEHHNKRIDAAVGVEAKVDEDGYKPLLVVAISTGTKDEAIELRIEPSRLLYGVDRTAYVEILKNASVVVLEEKVLQETIIEEVKPETPAKTMDKPLVQIVSNYTGSLASMQPALAAFLDAEGYYAANSHLDWASIINSLLATAENTVSIDWKKRENVQARLKVACKRVLIQLGIKDLEAETIAKRLLVWMRIQLPDK